MTAYEHIEQLRQHMEQQVIGQRHLVNRLLIALLADGHLLVEGAPGLAKTRAIRCLADAIEGDFQRIQFTPDLLPGDVTGTDIFRPQHNDFEFQRGPIFHNLVLADEINRAPAKVQSALLEAMAERQISVGNRSYTLPQLFLVMATQNPIEQEGTYPLPEAQLDRFLLHVLVDYPNTEAERKILHLVRSEASETTDKKLPNIAESVIHQARNEIMSIYMADAVEEYLIQLVMATRSPSQFSEQLSQWIEFGVSPRATIALDRCARAYAWLQQRDYVSPDDVQAICHDVLRHRLIISFEAEANGISSDKVIDEMLTSVPVA